MRIDIISAVPALLKGFFEHSIAKRAQDKGLVTIQIHDLRNYTVYKHQKIDDYPYGGGSGMVLMIEPIDRCIQYLKSQHDYDEILFMTPDGSVFNQSYANQLSLCKNLIILCGHYKGIDHRIRQHLITKEISVGDYVLTGGEIAASTVVDATIRLIPGVLNDETSALNDSFQDGLLSAEVYTRPANYLGWEVPQVLLNGHFGKIEQWQNQNAMDRTKTYRPDLLN